MLSAPSSILKSQAWLFAFAMLFGTALWQPAELARAENTAVLILPQPAPPPNRLPPWQIQVDTSGIEGQAYRGIKVTVTNGSNLPVKQNHTLRVEITPNGYGSGYYDEKVTDFIEVPEGATSADAIIDVPQRQQWNALHVKFFEGGEPLKNCAANVNQMRNGYRDWGDDAAGVLVIDSDAPTRDEYRAIMATIASPPKELKGRRKLPDVRWLLAAIPANQTSGNNVNLSYNEELYDDAQLLHTLATHEGIDLVPPAELDSHWLSNSNADLAVISHDDLQLLQRQHAERHAALLQWVMAGGSLVVYGCGDQWQRLPAVCQLVGLPPNSELPGEPGEWKLPEQAKFQDQVVGLLNQNQPNYPQPYMPGAVVDGSAASTPLTPPGQKKWTGPPFAWRRCGLGAVVAYKSENPFPGKPSDWGGLWNTLGSQQFLWSRRHGMSHRRENSDFWNFVIPGVGEPPVFSFMTMIGLFMLLIGPVNYYYLKRSRRLSLLLVTVPLGAGVFTLGLFTFALLSDGFSTRTRIRSYTVLEPQSGRAATISRQTYYTAFVPSEGMRYPADTAVYPMHYSPTDEAISNSYFYQSDSQWVDGKLQLQRRYLTARQHRQFMTVRSTKSPAKLEARSAGESLQVKNLLGTMIEYGLLMNDDGRLFAIENLAANTQATVPAIDPALAQSAWKKRLNLKAPVAPKNFDPSRHDALFSRNRYRSYGRNQSQWTPTHGTSLLEQGIYESDMVLNRLRNGDSQATTGQQRTFMAITAESITAEDGEPLAPLGVRGSRVMESLHVVRGRW